MVLAISSPFKLFPKSVQVKFLHARQNFFCLFGNAYKVAVRPQKSMSSALVNTLRVMKLAHNPVKIKSNFLNLAKKT